MKYRYVSLIFLFLIFSCISQRGRNGKSQQSECQYLIDELIHQGDELCNRARFSSDYELDKMKMLNEAKYIYKQALDIECLDADTSDILRGILRAELMIQQLESDLQDKINGKKEQCSKLLRDADEKYENRDLVKAKQIYERYIYICVTTVKNMSILKLLKLIQ